MGILDYHPISNMLPLIEEAALQELVNDIRLNGLLEPVILFEDQILDGRNRYRACQIAGVEPRYAQFEGTPEEAISRVWSLNIPRRHLTSDQRACCDALRNKLLDSYAAVREAAKARQVATSVDAPRNEKGQLQPAGKKLETKPNPVNESPVREKVTAPDGLTREIRAKAAGTNACYISQADRLLKEEPEVFMQVQAGRKRLSRIGRERAALRGNGRGHKPAPAKPATTPAVSNSQRRFQERHVSYIDACVKAGRPLSIADIAKITGLAENNIEKNSILQYWALVPWLTLICTPRPPFLYSFKIDRYLRTICEGRVPRPSLGLQSILSSLSALRKEIDRRRGEAKAKRIEKQWNPTAVRAFELIELLNYIEQQLDSLNEIDHNPLTEPHTNTWPTEELKNGNQAAIR